MHMMKSLAAFALLLVPVLACEVHVGDGKSQPAAYPNGGAPPPAPPPAPPAPVTATPATPTAPATTPAPSASAPAPARSGPLPQMPAGTSF